MAGVTVKQLHMKGIKKTTKRKKKKSHLLQYHRGKGLRSLMNQWLRKVAQIIMVCCKQSTSQRWGAFSVILCQKEGRGRKMTMQLEKSVKLGLYYFALAGDVLLDERSVIHPLASEHFAC